MINSIQGSETEKNLMISFTGESQARNRYTFYASIAKKEGYKQISDIFLETANNEKEHAKIFFKYLEDEPVIITAKFLTGLKDTKENLKIAIQGEHEENSNLYPYFAEVANSEGFPEIGETFNQISIVEKTHEERYKKILDNLEKNILFKRDINVDWICTNCGYKINNKEAPQKCPACKHPQEYFELWCPNY